MDAWCLEKVLYSCLVSPSLETFPNYKQKFSASSKEVRDPFTVLLYKNKVNVLTSQLADIFHRIQYQHDAQVFPPLSSFIYNIVLFLTVKISI